MTNQKQQQRSSLKPISSQRALPTLKGTSSRLLTHHCGVVFTIQGKREREGGGVEGGREREREADRQTDRQTDRDRERGNGGIVGF